MRPIALPTGLRRRQAERRAAQCRANASAARQAGLQRVGEVGDDAVDLRVILERVYEAAGTNTWTSREIVDAGIAADAALLGRLLGQRAGQRVGRFRVVRHDSTRYGREWSLMLL